MFEYYCCIIELANNVSVLPANILDILIDFSFELVFVLYITSKHLFLQIY